MSAGRPGGVDRGGEQRDVRRGGGAASASLIAAVGSLLEPLEGALRGMGSVCVAFSGGVDSSVVLAVAVRVLGVERVLAFTAVSETYRDEELVAAREFAAQLGVRQRTWRTSELTDPSFAANSRDRCYHCKSTMLAAMETTAVETGMATLVDGVNRDDLDDERPGLRATAEHGVRHPLVEAGIGKAAVRALARALDLPMWNRPAQACLASRIAYGQEITADKLRQVASAEDVLRGLGFAGQLRVRHHGDIARIELEDEELARAGGAELRAALTRRLRALGFTYVTLDLQGFRSGSMNEAPADAPGAAASGGDGAANAYDRGGATDDVATDTDDRATSADDHAAATDGVSPDDGERRSGPTPRPVG